MLVTQTFSIKISETVNGKLHMLAAGTWTPPAVPQLHGHYIPRQVLDDLSDIEIGPSTDGGSATIEHQGHSYVVSYELSTPVR